MLALSIGWALDSFEVQIIGSVLTLLTTDFGLLGADGAISPGAVSLIWVVWFAGLLIGATAFGWLADRYGRKRLFVATLVMYSIATVVSAFSPTFGVFLLFRFITAMGVGGGVLGGDLGHRGVHAQPPARRRHRRHDELLVGRRNRGRIGQDLLPEQLRGRPARVGRGHLVGVAAMPAGRRGGGDLCADRPPRHSGIAVVAGFPRPPGRANAIITKISGMEDDGTDLVGRPNNRSFAAQIGELWKSWRPPAGVRHGAGVLR